MRTAAVLVAVSLLSTLSPAQEDDAKPDAGQAGLQITVETIAGRVSVPAGGLSIERDGDMPQLLVGERRWPLDEVLFLSLTTSIEPADDTLTFLLRGGDQLRGEVTSGGEDEVAVSSQAFAKAVRVGVADLEGFVVDGAFRGPEDRARFLARLLEKAPAADRLHLRSGEDIGGVLDEISPTGVRFSSETLGEIEREFTRLVAVRLTDLGGERAARPPATIVVSLADGGSLSGTLESLSPEEVGFTHPLLGELVARLSAVRQISFRGGRCQFLSDWQPVSVKQHLGALFGNGAPATYRFEHYQPDRTVLGAPLALGGTVYPKGLGVHSYCLLEYDLGGRFERFQATIGIDDSVRPQALRTLDPVGNVVFRVLLDGKKLLEAPMSHKDAPRDIDLDVRGGNRLGLEVDLGADLFPSLDRADWANARAIR